MTKLEEAILEVYQTESEKYADPVYPFANPHSAHDIIRRIQRGARIAVDA